MMQKSEKLDTVQKASEKLRFLCRAERTNVFCNGYQQRLSCLKIPAVIYQNFNVKFQEAH